jgi:deazaflavin-dependent oxidoreductase (nitroreductase family)
MSESAKPGRGMGSFLKEHRRRYLASGGRDGHIVDTTSVGTPRFSPTLVLRTHGRRSGDPYLTPLTYGLWGDEWVVIASKGGAPDHPAWYLNLRSAPTCEMQVATQTFRCAWREAGGEERRRVWDYMCGLYAPFRTYERTVGERVIPVIMLKLLEEVTARS